MITATKRRRWWKIRDVTINAPENERFAQELAAHGIVHSHDSLANVTFWRLTAAGALAYFGVDSNDVDQISAWADLRLRAATRLTKWLDGKRRTLLPC